MASSLAAPTSSLSLPPPPRFPPVASLLGSGAFLGGAQPAALPVPAVVSFLELTRRRSGPRHLRLAPHTPGGQSTLVELPVPRREPHYNMLGGGQLERSRTDRPVAAGRPVAPAEPGGGPAPLWDPNLLSPGAATPFIMPNPLQQDTSWATKEQFEQIDHNQMYLPLMHWMHPSTLQTPVSAKRCI